MLRKHLTPIYRIGVLIRLIETQGQSGNQIKLLSVRLDQQLKKLRLIPKFETGTALHQRPVWNFSCKAAAAAAAKSLQSCPTLCDPIDDSPPGSPGPGILQATTLEWVAISFSNARMHAKLLQSCPTLCDPTDSSPPGSSVHRILQARILEWVAISFSKVCCVEYSKPSV